VGEVLLYTLSFVLQIACASWILRRDVRGLEGAFLARAWPDSTLWMAAVMLGPLALPWHFIRTRRSWPGLGLGLGWMLAALVATEAPVWALDEIFHVSDGPAPAAAPNVGNNHG
jgi:hypothetical protein